MRAAGRAVRTPGATAHPGHVNLGNGGRHFYSDAAGSGYFSTFGEVFGQYPALPVGAGIPGVSSSVWAYPTTAVEMQQMYFDKDNGSSSGTDDYEYADHHLGAYLAEVDPEMHGDVLHHEYLMEALETVLWEAFSFP